MIAKGRVLPPSINYDSPRELRAFLEGRGLGMRKKFGQNFLINPSARSKLLDALELKPGDKVWEIGPGLGAMTAGLLERCAQITAFEIDPAFALILKELFGMEPSFTLIEGDVLKTWPAVQAALLNSQAKDKNLFLFGNLPYNIAAALLADFIEKQRFFNRMVVTVQREVALRMAAGPGSVDYSSFSILCSSVYDVKLLHKISAASFFPAPRVDSQGVRFDLRADKKKIPLLFYPLVRNLFSSRRKTIRNSLSAFAASVIMERKYPGGTSLNVKETAMEALELAGISGDCRAETLGIDEFAALAASLEEIISHG